MSDAFLEKEKENLSRRVRRRVETRERIFEAAMRLLAERDFDAVTVEMITEAADVGKGTFFNYFDNKEAVVVSFFEWKIRMLTESLQTMLAAFSAQETSAPIRIWEQMRAVGHLVSERESRSKRFARTLLALTLTNPAVSEANLSVRERVVGMMTEVMKAGQAGGEFRADVSPEQLVRLLMNVHVQVVYDWALSETEESLFTALDRTYQLVLEGVRPLDNFPKKDRPH